MSTAELGWTQPSADGGARSPLRGRPGIRAPVGSRHSVPPDRKPSTARTPRIDASIAADVSPYAAARAARAYLRDEHQRAGVLIEDGLGTAR